MYRVVSIAVLFAACAGAFAADEPDSLDEDFLAYLAEFEGEDDDWTIVETAPTAPAKRPPAPPPKPEPSKPDKASPAADGSKR